jgi:hypothetical protein
MIDTNDLKTFKISNGALKDETLPQRLKFFAWGDNKSTDGNFRAGEKTSAELAANQKKYGFERVAIDFNHCSVPGTDTYKDLLKLGQPPLIFGYGRVEAIPNDGLYLEDIVWTPLGVQHARNFEDLSPAIQDVNGEVTLVHSIALTPNGKVEGTGKRSTCTVCLERKTADIVICGRDVRFAGNGRRKRCFREVERRITHFVNYV